MNANINSAEPASVALNFDADQTEESDQRSEQSTEQSTVEYGGWRFTAPVSMLEAKVPAKPGLFVIQVRERFWAMREFEPIDFGQSANLYRRLMVDGDDCFVRWLMHPRARSGLYVSLMVADIMGAGARKFLQWKLIEQYLRSAAEPRLESTREFDERRFREQRNPERDSLLIINKHRIR
jgi:hypothetical protein